jgi:hypothetical protein
MSGQRKSFHAERKAKMRQGAEHGLRQGKDDAREDVPGAGAVDARGVFQLGGQGEEELAQEEDAEGEGHGRLGNDQSLVGAEPAELLGQDVLGHEHHRVGNHEAAHEEGEDRVAPGKAHAGERIGGERAREHHEDTAPARRWCC